MFPAGDSNAMNQNTSNSFYYLCRLTSILGGILPLVYSLKPNYKEAWKSIRRTECALDEWEDEVPECLDGLRRSREQYSSKPRAGGLWFYYLTVKLMLNRLAFRVCLQHSTVALKD